MPTFDRLTNYMRFFLHLLAGFSHGCTKTSPRVSYTLAGRRSPHPRGGERLFFGVPKPRSRFWHPKPPKKHGASPTTFSCSVQGRGVCGTWRFCWHNVPAKPPGHSYFPPSGKERCRGMGGYYTPAASHLSALIYLCVLTKPSKRIILLLEYDDIRI